MAGKLYGAVKSIVNDISGLQVEPSAQPAISAVDKNDLIANLNAAPTVRSQILANKEITAFAFEFQQNADSWTARVNTYFDDGTISKVGLTDVPLADAVAFIESWGGTVITPTGNASSSVTLSGITYGTATKQITKLYGSVNGQTKEVKKLYGSVNGLTKLILNNP